MKEIQKQELNILKQLDYICDQNNIPYFLYAGTLLGSVRHKGFIPWDDDVDIALLRSDFIKLDKILRNTDLTNFDLRYQSNSMYKFYANGFTKLRNNDKSIVENVSKTQKGYYGAWVDIFPLDKIPNNEVERRKQFESISKINKKIKFFTLTQESSSDKKPVWFLKRIIRFFNEFLHPVYFFIPKWISKREHIMTMYNNDPSPLHAADLSYLYYSSYEDYIKTSIDIAKIQPLKKGAFSDFNFSIPNNYEDFLTNLYGDYMVIPPEKDRKVHNLL